MIGPQGLSQNIKEVWNVDCPPSAKRWRTESQKRSSEPLAVPSNIQSSLTIQKKLIPRNSLAHITGKLGLLHISEVLHSRYTSAYHASREPDCGLGYFQSSTASNAGGLNHTFMGVKALRRRI